MHMEDADVNTSCRSKLYASVLLLSLSADKWVVVWVLVHNHLDAIKSQLHTYVLPFDIGIEVWPHLHQFCVNHWYQLLIPIEYLISTSLDCVRNLYLSIDLETERPCFFILVLQLFRSEELVIGYQFVFAEWFDDVVIAKISLVSFTFFSPPAGSVPSTVDTIFTEPPP